MIILDTNVISEPLRQTPNVRVLQWLDRQPPESLFITAITLAELRAGVAVLPVGRRKNALSAGVSDLIGGYLDGRLLPFDQRAAEAYAVIREDSRAMGRPLETLDCQIAAIAPAQGFAVATRDMAPFEAAGVPVINPWSAE